MVEVTQEAIESVRLMALGRWATNYAARNPIKTASMLAWLIGGSVLLLHFAQIHYVPDIDPGDVVFLVVLSAFLGAGLLFVLAVMYLGPTFIFLRWTNKGWLPAFSRVKSIDSDSASAAAEAEVNRSAGRIVAIGFLGAVIAALIYTISVLSLVAWLPGLIFFVSTLIVVGYLAWTDDRMEPHDWLKNQSIGGKLLAFIFLYLMCFPPVVVVHADAFRQSPGAAVAALVIVLALTFALHVAVYLSQRQRLRARVTIVVAIVAYSTVMSGFLGGVPRTVARYLGFGMIEDAVIIVTTDGCRLVDARLNTRVCVGAAKDAFFELRGMPVQTRLGQNIVLTNSLAPDEVEYTIELPKSEVRMFGREKGAATTRIVPLPRLLLLQ